MVSSLCAVGTMRGSSGEHAVHVRVNLAHIGVQRGVMRNGGRIGTAAAQGRNVAALTVHTLETGHNRDVAGLDGLTDAIGRTSTRRAEPCTPSVIMPA